MKDLKTRIPWLGMKLLKILVPDHNLGLIIGDFEEYIASKKDERGHRIAILLFWYQLFLSIPAFVIQSMKFRILIFQHSIQMAVRNLRKHFGHSLVNLAGLSIGIACFLIILLYVQDERSFDTFHEKSDRIYRVLDFRKVDDMGEESASAPTPLAERMLFDYPNEVKAVVRFFNFQAPTLALASQEPSGDIRQFNEPRLFFVDKEFFQVFDFKLREGDHTYALKGPNKIILSAAMAEKYFDSKDPLGKILQFEDKHDFVVSGVLDELPSNTHLKFDFLVSFETLDNPEVLQPGLRAHWIWNPSWTYLLLKPGISPEALEKQFPLFVKKHFPESRHDRVKLYLQPLEYIHLHSNLDYEMGPNGNVIYVRIFATIAIFIILISCMNFINLVTARSGKRFIEMGIRKVLGSNRAQLIWQLIHESFFLIFIALLLALLIVWITLPFVNELTSKDLVLDPIQHPWMFKWLIITYLSVSTISGVYPAFAISRFQPSQVIKGYLASFGSKGITVRKFLVVGQFSLSMILIIGTIVALMQFDYLQKQKLGFQPEQVVLLPTLRSPLMERYEAFKGTLLQNPDILSLTTVEDVPGMRHQTGGYETVEGTELQFPRLIVHDDFAKTLGIEMAAGRDFLTEFSSDADDAVIINEAMVSRLSWASPEAALGKLFDGEKVVGVVKDFHFSSLHHPIGPFVLERIFPDSKSMSFSARYIAVRLQTKRIQETLVFIENKWMLFAPTTPFEYRFLDNMLAAQYKGESTLSKLVAVFCSLSILIACLGLYGLASFTVRQRLKEIGIRKVMGASVSGLVLMFSSSFIKLVSFSILLAWPIAYLLIDEWLQEFVYRIEMTIWPFLISGILVLFIVFLTVSFQALKASLTNPVSTLQNE